MSAMSLLIHVGSSRPFEDLMSYDPAMNPVHCRSVPERSDGHCPHSVEVASRRAETPTVQSGNSGRQVQTLPAPSIGGDRGPQDVERLNQLRI